MYKLELNLFGGIKNFFIAIFVLCFLNTIMTNSLSSVKKPDIPEEPTHLGEAFEFEIGEFGSYRLPEGKLEASTEDLLESILAADILCKDTNESWEKFYEQLCFDVEGLYTLLHREDFTEVLLFRYRHTPLLTAKEEMKLLRNGFDSKDDPLYRDYTIFQRLDTMLLFDQFLNGRYSGDELEQVRGVLREQKLKRWVAGSTMPDANIPGLLALGCFKLQC